MTEAPILTKASEVRQYAQSMELARIDFLDKNGKYAQEFEQTKSVHIVFVDGKEARLTMKKFMKLQDMKFRLRPSLDH